ncbi:5'-methylthioadenosine/S-adenosylhomocysteine nucleosidase [bioreactor metagenome]|uniref:adenosylhomocysteine nucleosidase n=1 Tax=bioreactor metagenome TaxID=1076179 RepID=A0A645A8T3_9ZZZZ|nr:5'-methylthioadenosine/adenosylhomocysteine nucleosidase [Erysipelotrichaceae bacterium]
MIGIIAAMAEEVQAVLDHMTELRTIDLHSFHFIQGNLNGREIIITESGVGKVQAAIATTVLLTNFSIEGIINVGIAGSLKKELTVGHVVIADKVAQWDFDLSAFGIVKGFSTERYTIQADLMKVEKLHLLMHDDQFSHIGPMVTGDQFVYNEEQLRIIKASYPEALCVDMEAGSIAQVSRFYHIPFLIVRSISDVTTEDGNETVFEEVIRHACAVAAQYCSQAVGIFD